jgi:hypothetical protein
MKIITKLSVLAVLFSAQAYAGLQQHPNIEKAVKASKEAVADMKAAQAANKPNAMEGHASKAIDLLGQAEKEMMNAVMALDKAHLPPVPVKK